MKLHGRVRRGRGVSHFVRQLAERTHARSAESHVSFTPQLRSGLSVAFRIHPVRNSVSNGVHPRANAPESEFQTKDQLFGGTRFARPTLWVLLYLFLQNWSVFTIALELTLSKIRDERKPRHRLASLGNPKEKCSLLFGFARARFFLKKESTFFFGVLPVKIFGQCGGAKCNDETKQNYFCGRKGFALSRLFLFLDGVPRRAGGCGRNARRIF